MATYKTVMRPALEYASSIWSPLASSISINGSNDSIWQIGVNSFIHPGPSSSRSTFFMESSQLCAATLTHYSAESLTTGTEYAPLLLLLALPGDVHPNPGPSRYPSTAHTPTLSDKTFNILQWNANGIGNKQTELSIFLEAHNVKVVAIQESKLTAKSRSLNIQNYTLVQQDRRQGPGGGLLFFYS